MTVEEAISGALALIGFGRATAKISAILAGRVQKLWPKYSTVFGLCSLFRKFP